MPFTAASACSGRSAAGHAARRWLVTTWAAPGHPGAESSESSPAPGGAGTWATTEVVAVVGPWFIFERKCSFLQFVPKFTQNTMSTSVKTCNQMSELKLERRKAKFRMRYYGVAAPFIYPAEVRVFANHRELRVELRFNRRQPSRTPMRIQGAVGEFARGFTQATSPPFPCGWVGCARKLSRQDGHY